MTTNVPINLTGMQISAFHLTVFENYVKVFSVITFIFLSVYPMLYPWGVVADW